MAKWLTYPFAKSRAANEDALRQLLYPGAEVINEHKSTKTPHFIVKDVSDKGITFHCEDWPDKSPILRTWMEFFRWLRVNSPIDGLRLLAKA